MATAPTISEVSDQQHARFADLIYKRTGIRIPAMKKSLMSNRVRRRLKATGIECFDAYYRHLTQLKNGDAEWDAFLQEITTHESFLFRDGAQWDWFRNKFLKTLEADVLKKKRQRSLRIWSAACSTGDEAHTIACCIAATLTDPAKWKVEIVGTDIGIGALETARKSTYGKRAMQLVPEQYKKKFFTAGPDETWTAKSVITRWMTFRQHNLMEPLQGPKFDLIVVKNVLIYFDAQSKKQVFQHVDNMLVEEGHILTGPAEGIADLLKQYKRELPWLHKKQK